MDEDPETERFLVDRLGIPAVSTNEKKEWCVEIRNKGRKGKDVRKGRKDVR